MTVNELLESFQPGSRVWDDVSGITARDLAYIYNYPEGWALHMKPTLVDFVFKITDVVESMFEAIGCPMYHSIGRDLVQEYEFLFRRDGELASVPLVPINIISFLILYQQEYELRNNKKDASDLFKYLLCDMVTNQHVLARTYDEYSETATSWANHSEILEKLVDLYQ